MLKLLSPMFPSAPVAVPSMASAPLRLRKPSALLPPLSGTPEFAQMLITSGELMVSATPTSELRLTLPLTPKLSLMLLSAPVAALSMACAPPLPRRLLAPSTSRLSWFALLMLMVFGPPRVPASPTLVLVLMPTVQKSPMSRPAQEAVPSMEFAPPRTSPTFAI